MLFEDTVGCALRSVLTSHFPGRLREGKSEVGEMEPMDGRNQKVFECFLKLKGENESIINK